jgi:hypothetical protein
MACHEPRTHCFFTARVRGAARALALYQSQKLRFCSGTGHVPPTVMAMYYSLRSSTWQAVPCTRAMAISSFREWYMVLEEGVEPSQAYAYRFLRPTCMPFHHSSVVKNSLRPTINRHSKSCSFFTPHMGNLRFLKAIPYFLTPEAKSYSGCAPYLSGFSLTRAANGTVVELTRIELVTSQCHCDVIPLHHSPT